jgi:hypothetical protein
MSYHFSDHFYPTALSASLNANTSDNVIQVDTLDGAFADDVRSGGQFPLRIGRGANQERVLVTGVNDEANNKLTVERNGGPYGLKSHPAGSRVAHALPAWHANKASGLPEAQGAQDAEIQTLRAAIDKLEQRVTTLENA